MLKEMSDTVKLKNSYFFTIRDKVKDEDSTSSNLLVRSGMIKKISSGIYSYLPLGYLVLKKIEKIIREEMNREDAQELLMPSLIPSEIYEKSGRLQHFGSSVFSLQDRYQKKYILGPTHEELFAIAGIPNVQSYKDLPFNLYQFQTKFRDEARPRFGLIRVREFIMKDAYSFDVDLDGLDHSYQRMYRAYQKAFDRMKLHYKIVKADTGVMGGFLSEEFQAITDIGEDTVVLCNHCNYASNIEISPCVTNKVPTHEEELPLEKVYTPNAGKIKEIKELDSLTSEKLVKCLIYRADQEFIMAMVPGESEINESKLQKILNVRELMLATEEDVERITKARIGFAGPLGLDLRIVADDSLRDIKNMVVGANQTDHHYKNANSIRDFTVSIYGDIRKIKEGDSCPQCSGAIYFKKGIEIGNLFKLGTKYAESLGLTYLDSHNLLNPVLMGSYGIGLGRCMAAIAEQYNDTKGLQWPMEVAPYQVGITLIQSKDLDQSHYAEQLYQTLVKENIDVLLDDRDERPGIKFNDMDLIGIPIRITIGKKLEQGLIELKLRTKEQWEDISIDNVLSRIKEIIEEEKNKDL